MSLDYRWILRARNSWQARIADTLRLICRGAVIAGVAMPSPLNYYAGGLALSAALAAGMFGDGDPTSFLKS
jgi:hypothetical protein